MTNNRQNDRTMYSGQKVSLNIRITPKRRAALQELAKYQEKTLTQVVEEAIDAYVMPKVQR